MTSGKPFKGFFKCPNCNTLVTVFGDKRECNICQTLPDGNKTNIPEARDLKVVEGDSHQVETSPTCSPGSNWSVDRRYTTALSNCASDYGTQTPEIPKTNPPSQVQSMQQSKPKSSEALVEESIRASGPSSVYSYTSSPENEDTSSKKSWSPLSTGANKGSEIGSSQTRSMRRYRSSLSTDANKGKEWSVSGEKQHEESSASSIPYGRNSGMFSHLRPPSADSDDICSVLSWTASERDDSIGFRSPAYIPLPTRLTEHESNQGFYDQGRERSGYSGMRMEGNQQQFRQTLPKDRPFGEPIIPQIKGYCCKHCKPETCRPFARFSPSPCCSNGMCNVCSHCCCGNGMWYGSMTESFCCHRSHSYCRAEVALRPEQTLKRLHLPICGAINFVLCYGCFLILQVPANFLFGRNKNNKLMCGGCRKILFFSLFDGIHIVPADADDPSGDSVAEDETGIRARGGQREPALHRLMGYSSARDILCEKSDCGSSRVRP